MRLPPLLFLLNILTFAFGYVLVPTSVEDCDGSRCQSSGGTCYRPSRWEKKVGHNYANDTLWGQVELKEPLVCCHHSTSHSYSCSIFIEDAPVRVPAIIPDYEEEPDVEEEDISSAPSLSSTGLALSWWVVGSTATLLTLLLLFNLLLGQRYRQAKVGLLSCLNFSFTIPQLRRSSACMLPVTRPGCSSLPHIVGCHMNLQPMGLSPIDTPLLTPLSS
jgi:hypothetical protein